MIVFDQDSYDIFLIENGVIGFYEDPVTLRSGRLSYWYANFRTLLTDLTKIDKAAEFIYSFVLQQGVLPTNFFAVPEGAREFVSSLNRILISDEFIPVTNLRSGYKSHGSFLDRYSIGSVSPWMKPILVEDVTTTGNSSTEYLMLLQELGVAPLALVSMLDRQERRSDGRSVKELVEDNYKVAYLPISNAERVLPRAVEKLKLKKSILEGLRRELNDKERYLMELKI